MSKDRESRQDDLAPKSPFSGLTYGSYLKVPELLDLQKCRTEGQSHDELLFIIIHQAYELWFKQILFELDSVAQLLQEDNLLEARRLMDRVIAIEQVLVSQIHILETMRPRDFCQFRAALRPASGFQSVQFREVEFLSGVRNPNYLKYLPEGSEERARLQRRLEEPSLGDLFLQMLHRAGYAVESLCPESAEEREAAARTLLPVYADPDVHAPLYHLCEALVSHDQWLTLWRFHHIRVVERVIGFKSGTGGSPGVPYLESTLDKRAFPLLWFARAYLDDDLLYQGPEHGKV